MVANTAYLLNYRLQTVWLLFSGCLKYGYMQTLTESNNGKCTCSQAPHQLLLFSIQVKVRDWITNPAFVDDFAAHKRFRRMFPASCRAKFATRAKWHDLYVRAVIKWVTGLSSITPRLGKSTHCDGIRCLPWVFDLPTISLPWRRQHTSPHQPPSFSSPSWSQLFLTFQLGRNCTEPLFIASPSPFFRDHVM